MKHTSATAANDGRRKHHNREPLFRKYGASIFISYWRLWQWANNTVEKSPMSIKPMKITHFIYNIPILQRLQLSPFLVRVTTYENLCLTSQQQEVTELYC